MEQQTKHKSLLLRRILAGLAGLLFFIPVFLLSFAVTCTWAEHHYQGDAQAPVAAFEPALIVAAILTILCCIFMARRVGKDDSGYWPRKGE
jgi:hypothetical protein